MNFSKKLVICVAFLCIASFAQQPPNNPKSITPQDSVHNSVSQNSGKGTVGITKPGEKTTWTMIKAMFE